MKAILLVLLAAVAVSALLVGLLPVRAVQPAAAAGPRPLVTGPDMATPSETSARLARLEEENRALRERIAALEARAEGTAGLRAAAGPEPIPPASALDGAEAGVAPDARWFLARYVASFREGGDGSEYYRLAVQAHAREVVGEIAALALDPGSNETLRLRLVEMLGDGMFRGHGRAISTLLSLVRAEQPPGLLRSAIGGLATIGDAAAGVQVERIAFALEPEWYPAVVELALDLAGEEVNAAVVRMLARAPRGEALHMLLDGIDHRDMEAALDAFRLLSAEDQATRLAAAQSVGNFHSPEFVAFVAQWAATEPDPDVRAALGAARETLATAPAYDPRRMIGPPDAGHANDDPNAWASANADMGRVWLELDYDPPRRASGLVVHQIYRGGALVEVQLRAPGGDWSQVWSGAPPTNDPVPFQLAFPPTSQAVSTVRLVLDTSRAPGWNEVDAVQLLGPDGAAWASGARASTSYAWR